MIANGVHTYSTKIEASHLDTFGHVNHATYLVILEQARWDILEELGIGFHRIQREKIGPVILEARIRYLRELTYGDEIKIESRFSSRENRVGKVVQEMFRADGELAARAEITFGLIDLKARKLVDPSNDWARLFNSLDADHSKPG